MKRNEIDEFLYNEQVTNRTVAEMLRRSKLKTEETARILRQLRCCRPGMVKRLTSQGAPGFSTRPLH